MVAPVDELGDSGRVFLPPRFFLLIIALGCRLQAHCFVLMWQRQKALHRGYYQVIFQSPFAIPAGFIAVIQYITSIGWYPKPLRKRTELHAAFQRVFAKSAELDNSCDSQQSPLVCRYARRVYLNIQHFTVLFVPHERSAVSFPTAGAGCTRTPGLRCPSLVVLALARLPVLSHSFHWVGEPAVCRRQRAHPLKGLSRRTPLHPRRVSPPVFQLQPRYHMSILTL